MRGDDGLGPLFVEAFDSLELEGVETVALDGEPTRLLDAWRDRHRVVVVDAVVAGDSPGTIHRLVLGRDPFPGATSQRSSHGSGLAEAVALSEALGGLPTELVVFGVEPADVTPGLGLSSPVAAVLDDLVAMVRAEVEP